MYFYKKIERPYFTLEGIVDRSFRREPKSMKGETGRTNYYCTEGNVSRCCLAGGRPIRGLLARGSGTARGRRLWPS